MPVKLFISYALNNVTTERVKDVFDTCFDNEVTQIMEFTKFDRDSGKPFKLFWITLDPSRNSRLWKFVEEIKQFGKANIIYETRKGTDYFWQVRINKEKTITSDDFVPRIMPRDTEPGEIVEKNDKRKAEIYVKDSKKVRISP